MIGVGDPRGWWLLASLALFLLALVRKLRRRTVRLTTFFLLRRIIDRHDLPRRRFRFLRRLAYLLFILAAALLAAAGLRPFYTSGASPIRELAVVDLSPSLGCLEEGRPRMEAVRRMISDYLALLQPQDELYVVTAGSKPAVLGPLTPGTGAADFADDLEPEDAPADIAGSLALASAVLGRGRFDHVLLWTDRPRRWQGRPEMDMLDPKPSFITLGRPEGNGGITAFDLRKDFFRPDTYDLFVKVAWQGPEPSNGAVDFRLEIAVNGRSVRTESGACPRGGSRDVLVLGVALEPGVLEVRLSPEDAYPADNVVRAGITPWGTVRVRAVTGKDSYLAKALSVNPSIDLAVVDPGELSSPDNRYTYVFDGLVPRGPLPERALFIQPTEALEGLPYRAVIPAAGKVEWEREDPALRGVDFEDLAVQDLYGFLSTPAFRPLATAEGYPLVLLSTDPRRRWAVVAFDPARGSFVYTPSYPILVANLVHWLTSLTGERQFWYPAGSSVGLPPPAAGGKVVTPSGRTLRYSDEGGAPMVRGSAAGRYRIYDGKGGLLGEFFTNVLNPEVTADIAASGSGGERAGLPPGIARGRVGLDLSPWLLLGSLLFLAAESWVARRQTSSLE